MSPALQTWAILTGRDLRTGKVAEASPLACAASACMESDDHGRKMFDLVYSYLRAVSRDGAAEATAVLI